MYRPRNKFEVVNALCFWYPNERKKFQRMKFTQLLAIYFYKQKGGAR